jgi:excisionase family DNA binding protein
MSKQGQQSQDDQLLTVSEVAEILRVDSTTVRRWIKNGILEAVSLPHVNTRQAYRIKRLTVNAILNRATQAQEAA